LFPGHRADSVENNAHRNMMYDNLQKAAQVVLMNAHSSKDMEVYGHLSGFGPLYLKRIMHKERYCIILTIFPLYANQGVQRNQVFFGDIENV